MKNYDYAVILYDPNGSPNDTQILSEHVTEEGALLHAWNAHSSLYVYVAHRKPNGEYETRLEARDRNERPPT